MHWLFILGLAAWAYLQAQRISKLSRQVDALTHEIDSLRETRVAPAPDVVAEPPAPENGRPRRDHRSAVHQLVAAPAPGSDGVQPP